MNAPVRAAIIGLGRWGQNLVNANVGNPASSLRFTHAATRSPQKAEEFCKEKGINLLSRFEEILASPDVDAVILATPHSQHADQICQAAAAGKHVFVEKPFTLTLADAERAVKAARAANVKLCVGFNRRFLPGFKALAENASDGTLGTLLHVEGAFSGSFGYGYTNDMWRGDTSENPAGGMAAMGIHILDTMIRLLGPVKRVSTISRHVAVPSDVKDVTNVSLDFVSGATGSLSTLMSTASFWRLHLFGSKGWGHMPEQTRLIMSDIDGKQDETSYGQIDTLALELDAFARAILHGEEYPVSHAQALAGVAAMEAISQSSNQDGMWIDVKSSDIAL